MTLTGIILMNSMGQLTHKIKAKVKTQGDYDKFYHYWNISHEIGSPIKSSSSGQTLSFGEINGGPCHYQN